MIMGIDLSETSTDALTCDDDNIVYVMCGSPLGNVGVDVAIYRVDIPCRDNAFRGGSIGKGGKVKYRRN